MTAMRLTSPPECNTTALNHWMRFSAEQAAGRSGMCQHFVSSDVPAFPYYTLAWACLFSSPRSIAALYDAYFGFVTFFCWLRRREQSLGIKIVWFILIMALGNMAMSAYVF